MVVHPAELIDGHAARPVYRSTGQMWATGARTLERLGRLGEKYGVTFCLENLNTILDHPGIPLARAKDTLALVQAAGHPNARLMLDLYHAQMGEGNLIELVRSALPYLGEIQVADVPGRCEPGTGEINYAAVAKALAEAGYEGTVGMEAYASGGSSSDDSDAALEAFRAAFTVPRHRASRMKDVILGLVGVGRIGVMHATNIAALNEVLNPQGTRVRLRLTDVAEEHARTVATGLGAEFLPSVEALLASGLDGLVIATGTGTHPELIKAGVDAGIPVFCEKPVALNVADALPVLDYIRDRHGVVQIGHQRRFDAGYLEARRAYQAGELGWIHSLRAVTCDMAPPPVEFLASSGGLFRDCSVHDFDILRWLTGREIVEVYAKGSNNGDPAIGEAGDVDTALALVTFDDGTVGTVSATRYNGAGHDVRLEIQGSRGSLMVGLDDKTALASAEAGVTFPAGQPHRTFAGRFEQAYRSEMAAFVELILGRRENPCTPEDAVAASRVADAAQESLATGRPGPRGGERRRLTACRRVWRRRCPAPVGRGAVPRAGSGTPRRRPGMVRAVRRPGSSTASGCHWTDATQRSGSSSASTVPSSATALTCRPPATRATA